MDQEKLLRGLPKVDTLISLAQHAYGESLYSHTQWLEAARTVVDTLRSQILERSVDQIPNESALLSLLLDTAKKQSLFSLRPAINATGVILHTNLGRAPLGEKVAEHIKLVAMGYSTLEYDVPTGQRGSRHSIVEPLLQKLTGAQAAMAVNNNAAAVLLALAACCAKKEVLVSRGELVEIGGSFRVPAVMAQSGAVMKEVGTTNKTHLHDYENAIVQGLTGGLLKVHTSNFKVVGFTEDVPAKELVQLGKKYQLPTIYDLGSGAFLEPVPHVFHNEPTVMDAFESGAEVITFSGDKLLGGPQAGIILGSKTAIAAMKAHPLARAFRMDKLTLAALEATLKLYLDPEQAIKDIPVLQAISLSRSQLLSRAETLAAMLVHVGKGFQLSVEKTQSQVGGGSLPGEELPSYGVFVSPDSLSLTTLEARLRNNDPPIIGRIVKDRFLMDMRTLPPCAFEAVVAAFATIFKERS
ncbi:MAG: L-seryl-tRNA(Sec) selenium transferase [Clostridiales bacterium]|nr:L-seryl-tRNA(Sec) selenium transferase [Clostridiales bacterium]